MRILLAVDFSPVGREVAFRGYHYAQQMGAKVTFLHVVGAMSNMVEGYNLHFYFSPEAHSAEEKILKAAHSQLNGLIDSVRNHYKAFPEPEWDERIAIGRSPGGEILKAADEGRCNMIVIGNKGYSTLDRVLIGSTALKVINSARCSVWLYRHTDGEEPLPELGLLDPDKAKGKDKEAPQQQ